MWIEAIGYAGAAFTIATYAVGAMIPLRILGLCSGFTFLTCAIITNDLPSAAMELILIPMNGFKLFGFFFLRLTSERLFRNVNAAKAARPDELVAQ